MSRYAQYYYMTKHFSDQVFAHDY